MQNSGLKKHVALLGGALVFAVGLVGCAKPDEGAGSESNNGNPSTEGKSIQVKGSNTLLQLGQKWAETYKGETGVTITVDGQGSGTGFAALIDGNTDIAAASRDIKDEERQKATAAGHDPVQTIVAQDGLSVIVNLDNKVSQLTEAQLADIFTGKVTNWKQVGGDDEPITVYSRDSSSGTFVFFRDHVLRHGDEKGPEQYAPSALLQQSTQAICDEVAKSKGAIGYVGMGYVDKTKQKDLKIAKDDKSPFVEPTVANVVNKSYPIARPLYYFTAGEPTGEVKKYIDWILGEEGQKIVKDMEYVPVK